MTFDDVVGYVVQVLESIGILVIVGGLIIATVVAARRLRRGTKQTYQAFRRDLGRSILLGLELLVAADIIRTVAIAQTFENVGVLALVIALRIVLGFSLELETNGRWPWQGGSHSKSGVADG